MSERPIYRLDHGSVLPEHRALPIPPRSRNKNSDFGKLFLTHRTQGVALGYPLAPRWGIKPFIVPQPQRGIMR